MKSAGRLSRYLALGVALVAAYLVANTAEAREGEAIVRAVRGTAFKVNQPAQQGQAGAERPLRVGDRLRSGDAVKTAARSEVDLFLNLNGPVVRIKQDSLLRLDKLTVEGGAEDAIIETEMGLESGQILGNVRKLAEASTYRIASPTTVAGIRGTQYSMMSSGQTTVISGTVVVVYVNPNTGDPTTLTVQAGQTFIPPEGGEDPTQADNVVSTPAEVEAAAINAVVAATTISNPDALQATIAELATAAATKAASLAAPGEANAAAAQAAQAAVNSAVATAQAAANATPGALGAAAQTAANNAAVNAQATAVAAAATGAAVVAASHATAAARAAGQSQAQVTEAATAAATEAANQAAAAAGADPGQVATIGGTIGSSVGAAVGAGPGQAPGAGIVPPVPPAVAQPPVTAPPTPPVAGPSIPVPPAPGPPTVPPTPGTRFLPPGSLPPGVTGN